MHPVQQALVDEQAPQCGYCMNGMVVKAAELLASKPDPSEAEIRTAMNGHLCRCGTYPSILRAIQQGGQAREHAQSDSPAIGLPRRQFLVGGGALVVGFSLSACVSPETGRKSRTRALRVPKAGPPDAKQVDTWLAIHSDNTATLYTGFAELGQGNTLALMQVAAEELDLDMDQIFTAPLDTHLSPNQGGTYSSASVQRGRPAIAAAAAEARAALLARAAVELKVPVERLAVSRGMVSVTGTAQVDYLWRAGGRRDLQCRDHRQGAPESHAASIAWWASVQRAPTLLARSVPATTTSSTCACPAWCTDASCARAARAPMEPAPE